MQIKIKNAYENNLKNIDLSIPKNKLIAFTGVSGSGKSTLALDTIQRECQRLYMESLGMTLNMGSKARVGSIEGLSPAISITQHQSNNNPRSTVGTITELTPYLRILFSKAGQPDSSDKTIDMVNITPNHFSHNKPEGACPHCSGIGQIHTPDVNTLIDMSKSILDFAIHGWDQVYIDRYGTSLREAARHYGFTLDLSIPVAEYDPVQMDLLLYGVLSEQFTSRFPSIAPPKTVPAGRFEGVVTNILRRYAQEGISPTQKKKLEKFFIRRQCPVCMGSKWNAQALNIYVCGENIRTVLQKSLFELQEWTVTLRQHLTAQILDITESLINTIQQKSAGLVDVGAGYLTLDQTAQTLSAGEWQRIKLTSVINSGLTGVLYVLDEPSAGLHHHDLDKITITLLKLRDLGNTVLIIEHNPAIIRSVDYIVDFGPGAGQNGGTIVAAGTVNDIVNTPDSLTGRYLANPQQEIKKAAEKSARFLTVKHAGLHNLKQVNTQIPLDSFVAVTGVSGSGKTSLIFGVIAEAAENFFKKRASTSPVKGLEQLNGVVTINHTSIGRSSRSNVATYTDLFNDIRTVYADLSRKEELAFTAKDFSTNTAGGRCEECQGSGTLSIPMHFLPDVDVTCHVCHGKRYKTEILEVKYKDHSISDVLSMDITAAAELFNGCDKVTAKLEILLEIGLGYLMVGQSTATLSGGEAQRLKLAKELMKPDKGNNLYLFDEPTTGLHPHDVLRLTKIFRRLVSQGNSVIAIEHNLNVIAQSDYVIDMGPGGGKDGGTVTACGTPADLLQNTCSITGKSLLSWNDRR